MVFSRIGFISGLLAASLAGATGAGAQVAPPANVWVRQAEAPKEAPKDATKAAPANVHGDWALRCVDTPAANQTPASRTCEVTQTIQLQGQQSVLAQIAFGRTKPKEPLRLTLVLPPNVGFPSTARMVLDEKGATKVEVPWKRCIPGACVAELVMTPAALQTLRAAKAPTRLEFTTGNGGTQAFAFSLKGFSAAIDALNKTYE